MHACHKAVLGMVPTLDTFFLEQQDYHTWASWPSVSGTHTWWNMVRQSNCSKHMLPHQKCYSALADEDGFCGFNALTAACTACCADGHPRSTDCAASPPWPYITLFSGPYLCIVWGNCSAENRSLESQLKLTQQQQRLYHLELLQLYNCHSCLGLQGGHKPANECCCQWTAKNANKHGHVCWSCHSLLQGQQHLSLHVSTAGYDFTIWN